MEFQQAALGQYQEQDTEVEFVVVVGVVELYVVVGGNVEVGAEVVVVVVGVEVVVERYVVVDMVDVEDVVVGVYVVTECVVVGGYGVQE